MALLADSKKIYDAVASKLNTTEGLLIGKIGTIECDVLWELVSGTYNKGSANILEKNAGVFPSTPASVKAWGEAMLQALDASDILALGWYAPTAKKEERLLKLWKGASVTLRALEPYYLDSSTSRWTDLLADSRVCVVSSFTQTAESQTKRSGKIWPNGLPKAIWSWVRTGYAPSVALGKAGWDSAESWEEAVNSVVTDVMKTDSRIVLIGCGGLGMLIGSKLKERGKICIVMGGAIQVLFGIKGRRWENHELSKFWNDAWVWPAADETPGLASGVERSCYWK